MPSRLSVPLAPGVWRVPTMRWDLINSFLLRDEDGQITIVDAGLRSAPDRLLQALDEIGSGPSDVTRILLTHAHVDHVGGAAQMARHTGRGASVHAEDAPYVASGKGPPTDRSTILGRLLRSGAAAQAVPVVEELSDGQVLPLAGGLRVLHTPGHTPGHISLLLPDPRILITGDAIWNMRSRMTWPVAPFCSDWALTRRTAAVLADQDYDIVAFTHGPEIRQGARDAVRGFLKRPRSVRSLLRP